MNWNAVAVYPGQKGLDSLRALHDDTQDDLLHLEQMHVQDCLMLSFNNKSELNPSDIEDIYAYCSKSGISLRGRNAFPQFDRLRSGYERWYLEDETDQMHMVEALEGAIEVTDRLSRESITPEQFGFSECLPNDKAIPLLTKQDGVYQWSAYRLPPRASATWPAIIIDDDLSVHRLKFAPRKGEWAARMFMYSRPFPLKLRTVKSPLTI